MATNNTSLPGNPIALSALVLSVFYVVFTTAAIIIAFKAYEFTSLGFTPALSLSSAARATIWLTDENLRLFGFGFNLVLAGVIWILFIVSMTTEFPPPPVGDNSLTRQDPRNIGLLCTLIFVIAGNVVQFVQAMHYVYRYWYPYKEVFGAEPVMVLVAGKVEVPVPIPLTGFRESAKKR